MGSRLNRRVKRKRHSLDLIGSTHSTVYYGSLEEAIGPTMVQEGKKSRKGRRVRVDSVVSIANVGTR